MADSPHWTDFNDSDPGVSVLELIAFLATGFLVMIGLGPLLERSGLANRVVTVRVEGRLWRQVETFVGTGPEDNVFRIGPDSGTVQFGDGEHGRIPPPGTAKIGSRYHCGPGALAAAGAIAGACAVWSVSIWRRWCRRRKP